MPDLVEIAKAALLEVTPETTIGAPSGQVEEGGATSVTFLANMAGYPGWHWTVAVSTLEGSEPSVLEVELMPGDGALLAPDWVPWSERLADYEAAQDALALDDADAEDDGAALDDSDEDADDESDDDDDSDDLGSDVLHGGDLDGVDIDEPDEPDEPYEPDEPDEFDDESEDDESDDDSDHDDGAEKSY